MQIYIVYVLKEILDKVERCLYIVSFLTSKATKHGYLQCLLVRCMLLILIRIKDYSIKSYDIADKHFETVVIRRATH